jgi:hypothetical protein
LHSPFERFAVHDDLREQPDCELYCGFCPA